MIRVDTGRGVYELTATNVYVKAKHAPPSHIWQWRVEAPICGGHLVSEDWDLESAVKKWRYAADKVETGQWSIGMQDYWGVFSMPDPVAAKSDIVPIPRCQPVTITQAAFQQLLAGGDLTVRGEP